jgi:hypothetical protein
MSSIIEDIKRLKLKLFEKEEELKIKINIDIKKNKKKENEVKFLSNLESSVKLLSSYKEKVYILNIGGGEVRISRSILENCYFKNTLIDLIEETKKNTENEEVVFIDESYSMFKIIFHIIRVFQKTSNKDNSNYNLNDSESKVKYVCGFSKNRKLIINLNRRQDINQIYHSLNKYFTEHYEEILELIELRNHNYKDITNETNVENRENAIGNRGGGVFRGGRNYNYNYDYNRNARYNNNYNYDY